MIQLGNDSEVAFTFSETPEGRPVCRVRVRAGSKSTTLEPNQAQFVDILRVMAKHLGVKMRSFAADQAPAAKCDPEPIDLASVSLADIAAAKREKLLAPIEAEAARVREEIERLEAWALNEGADPGDEALVEPRARRATAKPAASRLPPPGRKHRRTASGTWAKVREALSGGATNAKEVAEATGLDAQVCRRALTKLAIRGEVERIGRGVFRLAA